MTGIKSVTGQQRWSTCWQSSLPLTHYIENTVGIVLHLLTLRNIFSVVSTVRKRFVDLSGEQEKGKSMICITCRSCKTFLLRDMSHSFKSQVPGKVTALKAWSWNPWIQLQNSHWLPLCKTGAAEQQALWRCMLLSTWDTTVKKKILVYMALYCKFKWSR